MDLKKFNKNSVVRSNNKDLELGSDDDLIIRNPSSIPFLQNYNFSQSEYLTDFEDDLFASTFVKTERNFGSLADSGNFLFTSQNNSAPTGIQVQQGNATTFTDISKKAISDDFTYSFGNTTDIDKPEIPRKTGYDTDYTNNNLILPTADLNRNCENGINTSQLNNGLCEITSLPGSDSNIGYHDNILLSEVDVLTSSNFKDKTKINTERICSDTAKQFSNKMTSDSF